MEETLKLILTELHDLKEGQQEFKEELQGLKESQQEFKEELQGLKESQREFKEELQGLRESQKEFKESQQEFKLGLEELKESQQELRKDVSIIKDNLINGLGPYFGQIEKHIGDQTSELKEVLEDQQKVIDILAVRSLKHESDIKDLKHILKNQ